MKLHILLNPFRIIAFNLLVDYLSRIPALVDKKIQISKTAMAVLEGKISVTHAFLQCMRNGGKRGCHLATTRGTRNMVTQLPHIVSPTL